jgi:hypothetical protein
VTSPSIGIETSAHHLTVWTTSGELPPGTQLAIYREVILERSRRITRSLSKAQAKQVAPAAAIEPVEPVESRSSDRPTESESKQKTLAAVGIPAIMAVNVPT